MSRRPRVTIEQPKIDEMLVRQDLAAGDQRMGQLASIDEQLLNGERYNYEQAVWRLQQCAHHIGGWIFEMGRWLVLIKEHEPHGRFLEALERTEIAPRTAQAYMQATLKFSRPNAQPVAHLGLRKLLALANEDDRDIAALGEGGTIAGLHLDQMQRMSARELEAALRKEKEERRKEKEVHERVLKQKDERFNALLEKTERRETVSEAERHQALIDDLWAAVRALGEPLLRLEQAIAATREASAQAEGYTTTLDRAAADALGFLIQQLGDMGVRQEIEPSLDERVVPPFLAKVDELIRREYAERMRGEPGQTH